MIGMVMLDEFVKIKDFQLPPADFTFTDVQWNPGQGLLKIVFASHNKVSTDYSASFVTHFGKAFPPYETYCGSFEKLKQGSFGQNELTLMIPQTIISPYQSCQVEMWRGDQFKRSYLIEFLLPPVGSPIVGRCLLNQSPLAFITPSCNLSEKEKGILREKFSVEDNNSMLSNATSLMEQVAEIIGVQGNLENPSDKATPMDLLHHLHEGGDIQCAHAVDLLRAVLEAFGAMTRKIELFRYYPFHSSLTVNSHCVLEYFDGHFQKWVMLDPSYNLIFRKNSIPCSVADIYTFLGSDQLDLLTIEQGKNHSHCYTASVHVKNRDSTHYDYLSCYQVPTLIGYRGENTKLRRFVLGGPLGLGERLKF